MGSFSALHRQLHQNQARLQRPDDSLQQTKLGQHQYPLKQSQYQPQQEQLHVKFQQQQAQKQQQPTPQRQKLQPLDPNKSLQTPRSPFSLQRITERFNIFKMVATSNAYRAAATKTEIYSDESAEPVVKAVDDDVWKVTAPMTPTPETPAARPKKAVPRARATSKPLTPATTASKPRRRKSSFATYSDSTSSGASTPTSPRRSLGPSYAQVIDGRVAKSYRPRTPRQSIGPLISSSAAKRLGSADIVDELVSELNRDNEMDEARCEQHMEVEKSLYPGGESWAEDEERLFEALFMRQYRPILPESWTFDFRGIPAPDAIFARSAADVPLIYSCSGDNYQASRALVRVIQLTGTVRALVQSGVKAKAAAAIRAELFRYAKWAARDGGFGQRAVIPIFMLEVVDTSLSGSEVTAYIQGRMADLAEQHRDFLRRDPADAALFGPGHDPIEREFKRRPPVLFGLFIIHTMVLILTVDSAKPPDSAQVSYHVEVNFNTPYQGVWNALTVAIPVCMARDDMRKRLGDFPLLEADSDSDPDA